MLRGVGSKLVQGQADLLRGFRAQHETWPFRCKPVFLRFDKRYELRSNKVANVGTAPPSGHEQIVARRQVSESYVPTPRRREAARRDEILQSAGLGKAGCVCVTV